jgi:hypothetical protein
MTYRRRVYRDLFRPAKCASTPSLFQFSLTTIEVSVLWQVHRPSESFTTWCGDLIQFLINWAFDIALRFKWIKIWKFDGIVERKKCRRRRESETLFEVVIKVFESTKSTLFS